jgi:hypothetical protein
VCAAIAFAILTSIAVGRTVTSAIAKLLNDGESD